jgi:8-oxo-dGTP pyrophosphatase MutT (NUDIX family)
VSGGKPVDCGNLDDDPQNAGWLRTLNAGHSSGFRTCPVRGRHWGPLGAAGVIPWVAWAGRVVVLLGRRGPDVQDSGVWAGFGGAIEPDEEPAMAAMREFGEEIGGVLALPDVKSAYVDTCQSCGWRYHTFLARAALSGGRLPVACIRNFETDAACWVLLDEVPQLCLHPGLERAWPVLRAQLVAAAKQAAS